MIVHASNNPIILNELFGFKNKQMNEKEYNKKVDPKFKIFNQLSEDQINQMVTKGAASRIKTKYFKQGDNPADFTYKYKNVSVSQDKKPIITIEILKKGSPIGTEELKFDIRDSK